ncbi:MAG TPA: glycosyltransferase 87 family protein [Mycobacteriales bacterium]|nr:glycosyltransferase 87 family protein [Mycobacteriales bacterium]
MRGRWLAAGVAWAAAVLLAALAIYDATHRPDLFPDLTVYRAGAGAIEHGGDLYRVHGSNQGGFTYPPFAVLVLLPLRLPPLLASGLIVAALSFLGAVGTARMALRSAPAWVVGAVVACAMQTVAFRNSYAFGQIGVLLMLLVALDLFTDDPPWPRGMLIGLAAGIKLTPGVFIILLVLTRQRRQAVTAVAALATSIALGALVLPGASWRYWTNIAWHTGRVGDITSGRNRSLWGVLTHAGTPTTVAAGIAVVVTVVGLWWASTAYCRAPVAAVAAAGLTGCLVAPITWTHHLVWILLVLCVLMSLPYHLFYRAGLVAVTTIAFARLSPDTHLLAVVQATGSAVLVLALPWVTRRSSV